MSSQAPSPNDNTRAESPPLELPGGNDSQHHGRGRSQDPVSSLRPGSRSRRSAGGSMRPLNSDGFRTPVNDEYDNEEDDQLVPLDAFVAGTAAATPVSNLPRSDLYRGGKTPRGRRVMRSGGPAPGPTPSERTPQTYEGPSPGHVTSDRISAEAAFVWGTNISIDAIEQRFKSFVEGFHEPGEPESKYMTLLNNCLEHEKFVLNIDCHNVAAFDLDLYRYLVNYPMEVIPICDLVVRQLAASLKDTDPEDLPLIQIRPFHLQDVKPMRDLNPADVDRLVSVRGMVTRMSSIIPDLKSAFFQCDVCGKNEAVFSNAGRLEEPSRCGNCHNGFTMRLIHNRSRFSDKQMVKMQETPDAIPEGETPHTVNLYMFEDLVDICKPGDRVEIVGVYRAVPMRVSQKVRNLKAVYKTYLDVIHVKRMDAPGKKANETSLADILVNGADDHDLTEAQITERKEEILQIARADDFETLYDKLATALAPSIFKLDDIKKGVLCQLFSGVSKEFTGGRVRGEMNVLLVGDPGVSKSQLLSYVHKIAPRGIYTSGRGSSAVGLTAYVTKDPDTRESVLESGALVLSDMGVCCIDEFDKMSDSARSMLHEVMEQQTVSVAKAGIVCCLNARTSVLASANPIGSRYDPNLSIVDNIQLPPSLMSRFDLIYLVLDKQNELMDRQLAHHLTSMYTARAKKAVPNPITPQLLRDYIAYARLTCQPEMTEESRQRLVDSYKEMRAVGASRKVISATPRQLESLIRLSESLARMELNPKVELKHVEEAVRLFKSAMQEAAMDKTTGVIDMSLINTGISSMTRIRGTEVMNQILELMKNARANIVSKEDIRRGLAERGVEGVGPELLEHALQLAVMQGRVRLPNRTDVILVGEREARDNAAAAAEFEM